MFDWNNVKTKKNLFFNNISVTDGFDDSGQFLKKTITNKKNTTLYSRTVIVCKYFLPPALRNCLMAFAFLGSRNNYR